MKTTFTDHNVIGLTLTLAAVPFAVVADGALNPTITPTQRPYPYEILNMQPGATALDAQSMFQERMMLQMDPQDVEVRVQSGQGREIEFRFIQEMTTRGVGPSTFLGNEPYAQMRMLLATDVMEGRVMRIARTMRQPSSELPEPAALRAQIEDIYGPPSEVKFDGITQAMTLTYAWATDGLIADINAVPEQTFEHDSGNGNMRAVTYRPCIKPNLELGYRFENLRHTPIAPGCLAIFQVRFTGKADLSTISFTPSDMDL